MLLRGDSFERRKLVSLRAGSRLLDSDGDRRDKNTSLGSRHDVEVIVVERGISSGIHDNRGLVHHRDQRRGTRA